MVIVVAQAQVVAFAVDRGRLTLALRNPDDIAVLEDLPETTIQTIRDAEKRARDLEPKRPGRDRSAGDDT